MVKIEWTEGAVVWWYRASVIEWRSTSYRKIKMKTRALMTVKALEEVLSNGKVGKAIAQAMGKPGACASDWPGTPQA